MAGSEAVGKVFHQLMKTVFPPPLEVITAELLRDRPLGRGPFTPGGTGRRGYGVQPLVAGAGRARVAGAIMGTSNDLPIASGAGGAVPRT